MRRKKKTVPKTKKIPIIRHKVGDTYTIDGVRFIVRHVNNNKAWLTPTIDSPEFDLNRCIASVIMDEYGKVIKQ